MGRECVMANQLRCTSKSVDRLQNQMNELKQTERICLIVYALVSVLLCWYQQQFYRRHEQKCCPKHFGRWFYWIKFTCIRKKVPIFMFIIWHITTFPTDISFWMTEKPSAGINDSNFWATNFMCTTTIRQLTIRSTCVNVRTMHTCKLNNTTIYDATVEFRARADRWNRI